MSFLSTIPAALRLRIKPHLLPRIICGAAFSLLGGAELSAAEAELAWTANPDEENIAGYRVHYGITSGHYEHTDDVGTESSTTLENLGDGIQYFVALSAYNGEGLESALSEEFEFTTAAAASDTTDGSDRDPASSDGGSGVSDENSETDPETDSSESGDGEEVEGELPDGNATADLIWDANPEADGVAGYRLYYGTVSGSYPAMLDVGDSTSVTVTKLAEDTEYFVVLTAYNEEGLESPPSEEFQFLSSSNVPPEIYFSKVGGDDLTPTSGNMVLLATAFDEDGSISRVDFYDGTRLLHSDRDFPYALRVSGLDAGVHQLRAVAVDDSGDATESAALSVRVAAAVEQPEPVAAPTLTLSPSISGKTPLFKVTATPGSLVMLEASPDLSDWSVVSESRADDSGDVDITDPTPEDELPAQRFYRVVTQ